MTPLLFRQMLDTLHEAHGRLSVEIEQLSQARIDQATLLRIEEAARGFREQAHSLLVMMLYQHSPPALVVEAEALVGFFGEVVDQIEAMLAASRGWNLEREDRQMAETSKASDASVAEARMRALDEAAQEARRLAKEWRDEVDGTHSSHHSDLRRTWADGAERVAEAIAALDRQDGGEGSSKGR